MSFPLGNNREIVAHKISLIQGKKIVDARNLFAGAGSGNAQGSAIAASQVKDSEHDLAFAALGVKDSQ